MGEHTKHPRDAPFDFYPYNPNGAAGWVFVVFFAGATLVHLGLAIRYRAWFTIAFLLGCAAQAGGYYGRAMAHDHVRDSHAYLIQLFLIVGGTPLMSASIYMSLPRLARCLTSGERRMRWVSWLYIVLDIVCLVLQIMGLAMSAYGDSTQQSQAPKYIAGGLVFQLVAFLIFIALAAHLHRQLVEHPTEVSWHHHVPRWRLCFWGLYITSMLVLVRNLVRIIEYVQGNKGYVMTHEAFLYLFDATPMFLVAVVFGLFHPGRVIRFASKEFPKNPSMVENGPFVSS